MSIKQKRAMRAELKTVLANLDARWVHAASTQVCANLEGLLSGELAQGFPHLFAWVPFFAGEVDLSRSIDRQLDRRKVYLPRILEDFSMTFLEVAQDWSSGLHAGERGIPEPGANSSLYRGDSGEGVIILCPGLAFDAAGRRLGRGKGSYDRLLADPRFAAAIKVGVCFSVQMVPQVPESDHDVPMNWICHENACIRTDGFNDE